MDNLPVYCENNSIPLLNIADRNCWIVYLMPFSNEEKKNFSLVNKFQNDCIRRRIFGMGWSVSGIEKGTPISKNLFDFQTKRFCEECPQAKGEVSEKAFNNYVSIKKGDYVIARNKNGHYYVGKVSSDKAIFLCDKEDKTLSRLSWGCEVEQWKEYSLEGLVPSEIVGRFSQAQHSTIERIADYRQKLLVIAMYENQIAPMQREFTVPKVRICEENFAASLHYKELEDLVALYIYEKHKNDGYYLLPSSCKVSEPLYEFTFVSKDRKPITCQVKNKDTIDIDIYKDEHSYELIYIFSGLWSNEHVERLREIFRLNPNIHIIKPSELYPVIGNSVMQNEYYNYSASLDLPLESLRQKGYKEKKRALNAEKEYRISDNTLFIYFRKDNGLFYSSEFGALILSHHILDNHKEETDCANKIQKDLNRA